MREIRALCDKYSEWLHIDAGVSTWRSNARLGCLIVPSAFGAYARLVPDLVGPLADGLELADSIAPDGTS